MKRAREISKAVLGGEVVLLLLLVLAGHVAAQGSAPLDDAQFSIMSPPQADANTVLLLHLDETDGSLVTDDSGYANNGVAFGTTIVDGRFGKARSFNPTINFDSLDHITVQDSLSLDIQGDLTIEAWIRPGAQNEGGGVILSKWKASTNNSSYMLAYRSDIQKLHFFISEHCDGIGTRLFANAPFPSDGTEWHHVAAVYSPSNYMKVFVDGVETGSLTTGVPASLCNGNARLLIGTEDGGSRGGDGGISTPFTGAIDEVRISNIARAPGPLRVLIDIKPGSFPNSINPKSKGMIPVAILTTDTFDATTVDPTTVLFGPTGTEAAPVRSALKDVDRDGDTDMILHFKTQATGIQCGDTSASLTGETLNGQTIEGSDSIKTAGCK